MIRHVPSQGRAYVPLLMVGLFSSAGVNLLVKGPLATGVVTLTNTSRGLTAASPLWLLVFAWLLAPITEEAAKAAPLLVPRLRRRLHTSEDALWSAMALGMSYGIGEAVWVAFTISRDVSYAEMPSWAFVGYATERFIVCFGHGVMTALFVVGCYRGFRARGYFLAVALHAFANMGPFAALIGAWTPEGASLWSGGALLLMAFLFERMRGSDQPGVEPHEVLLVAREPHLVGMLLYDGDCGFCEASLKRLRSAVPRLGPAMPASEVDVERWNLTARDIEQRIYWIEPGGRAVGGAAAFGVALRQAGGVGALVGGFLALPGVRSLAEKVYGGVARHRHRLSHSPACRVRLPAVPH
ncbi:MAG TPA: DCC1-like thiol-disulfide oxidoreductase family protein, partial [Dermatophilaceae bacterium]|nr:DCC1-like thiol-disulfide oxidoreductase family protein [Dermatophilaceae bacterium]